jgi:hypothetical protein
MSKLAESACNQTIKSLVAEFLAFALRMPNTCTVDGLTLAPPPQIPATSVLKIYIAAVLPPFLENGFQYAVETLERLDICSRRRVAIDFM